MRNVLLALAAGVAFSGMAQLVSVASIQKVGVPESPDCVVAGISPQGDYLLLTTSSNKGLKKFDLATGTTTTVTEAAGAGFDAIISGDGEQIVYRETSFTPNHLRLVSLKSANLSTGRQASVAAPARDIDGAAIERAAVAHYGGQMGVRAAAATRPVLSIRNRQLMITENGATRQFSPNGPGHSYLWASVSPDGSKALYFIAGNGAWVCDIDGSNTRRLGILRAPQWLGNDLVVGMLDEDDGEFIYASHILVSDLDGNMQTLTADNVVAMYPYTTAAADKIAFSTPAGEAYIINLKK